MLKIADFSRTVLQPVGLITADRHNQTIPMRVSKKKKKNTQYTHNTQSKKLVILIGVGVQRQLYKGSNRTRKVGEYEIFKIIIETSLKDNYLKQN